MTSSSLRWARCSRRAAGAKRIRSSLWTKTVRPARRRVNQSRFPARRCAGAARPSVAFSLQPLRKLRRRLDCVAPAQRQQIVVARDQEVRRSRGERLQHVQVVAIAHFDALRRRFDDLGAQIDLPEEAADRLVVPLQDLADLRIREHAADLLELRERHYEVEPALAPGGDGAPGDAVREHQPRHQHIGVEDDLHLRAGLRRAALTASSMSAAPFSAPMLLKAFASHPADFSNSSSTLRSRSKVPMSMSAATGLPPLVMTMRPFRYWTSFSRSPRFWRTVMAGASRIMVVTSIDMVTLTLPLRPPVIYR